MKKELLDISHLPFDKIANIEMPYSNSKIPANSFYSEYIDVKNIAVQLICFLEVVYKNFKFVDFYDKTFIDTVKMLIKDTEEFPRFLEVIDMDAKTFIKLMIYVSPQVFTSNLIKFIQNIYLK